MIEREIKLLGLLSSMRVDEVAKELMPLKCLVLLLVNGVESCEIKVSIVSDLNFSFIFGPRSLISLIN